MLFLAVAIVCVEGWGSRALGTIPVVCGCRDVACSCCSRGSSVLPRGFAWPVTFQQKGLLGCLAD